MTVFLGLNSHGSFKTSDSLQHTLLIVSTGSGKGVSYYLPNLLHCEDSVVCHDIKGEIYEITHKYRESIGHKIFVFNPLDKNTNKYNPFDTINKKDKDLMYADIQKISYIFINGSCSKNVAARKLFVDIAISLINKNCTTSFGDILRNIKLDNTSEASLYLQSALELWNNPLIDNTTSSSDFDVKEFRNQKSTLYIVINPSDMNRLRPLMSFMYQHFIDALINVKYEDIKDKNGIRFFLDEFSTLGKMPEFENNIAYLRGYKVSLFLTIQNLHQLRSVYKDDTHSILNNVAFRISFHANDFETAEFIAKLCLNEKGFEVNDIITLSHDQQIVLNEVSRPVKEKKFRYFDNPILKARSLM